MFIDRERELAFLEEKWQEPKAQFIVLWGKRRVGKTELVKQFIKNKPHVYFLAESTNEKEQLHRFSNALGNFFKEPLLETRGFAGWEESFDFIKKKGNALSWLLMNFLIWYSPTRRCSVFSRRPGMSIGPKAILFWFFLGPVWP